LHPKGSAAPTLKKSRLKKAVAPHLGDTAISRLRRLRHISLFQRDRSSVSSQVTGGLTLPGRHDNKNNDNKTSQKAAGGNLMPATFVRRAALNRRALLAAGGGLAGIIATGRAPIFAQTQPKKLVFAHINAVPESAAVAFDWMAKELTARTNGALEMQFFGKTLIPQELEIMNAVKSGSIAMGSPAGAAATIFPEMGALLVPYLVKDYTTAYGMLNGQIGDKLSKQIEDNYKLKVLCYFDYGFRHFWTSKKPIIEPRDLRGLKIRVQQSKIFGDTINGLGGSAVPMAYGEVVTAAKQGVIDGGDLPVVNMKALKIYEVSKYASLTYHNYGPTNAVMNLDIWNGLTSDQQKLVLELSRTAQEKIRQLTESVDHFEEAKALLEPLGMTVVEAKVEEFRKVAQQKIWPAYKAQYGALWDEIEGFKA
jgi:tripartite ATP-independent transporter DctP family solute receptor